MADFADYAIIDAKEGSTSEGKILVLVDDERTAVEIATDLRGRGCAVVIRTVAARRESAAIAEEGRWSAPLPVPGAAV